MQLHEFYQQEKSTPVLFPIDAIFRHICSQNLRDNLGSLFAFDAGNLPYLRMAMKFRDLPTDQLQEFGEILLVVR